jgi:hypothetical protein
MHTISKGLLSVVLLIGLIGMVMTGCSGGSSDGRSSATTLMNANLR